MIRYLAPPFYTVSVWQAQIFFGEGASINWWWRWFLKKRTILLLCSANSWTNLKFFYSGNWSFIINKLLIMITESFIYCSGSKSYLSWNNTRLKNANLVINTFNKKSCPFYTVSVWQAQIFFGEGASINWWWRWFLKKRSILLLCRANSWTN